MLRTMRYYLRFETEIFKPTKFTDKQKFQKQNTNVALNDNYKYAY